MLAGDKAALALAVQRLFLPEEVGDVIDALDDEFGAEPDFQGQEALRLKCAALKLSGGSLNRLDAAIGLSRQDWRDLLVAAGFEHDLKAHETWLQAFAAQ